MRRTFLLLGPALLAFVCSQYAVAQSVQVDPNPLTFANVQPVGSPFPGALQVVITNPGSQTLNITQATVTGDFIFGSSPPSQSLNNFAVLAPGGRVGFVLMFNATASGPRSGTLTLTDNATGSPQTFSISGTGFVGAMVQPRNSALQFVTDTVGTPIAQVEDMVSVGNQAATVNGVTISGTGFSQTNTCGASMAQGQQCRITILYTSSVAGPQTGTLTVANTGVTSPITIPLTGDAADFILTPGPSAATVTAGQPATYFFSIASPLAGPLGLTPFTFACSGIPPGATCSFTASQPFPEGDARVQLVVSTTGQGAALRPRFPGWEWPLAGLAALVLIARKRRLRAAMIVVAAAMLVTGLGSCGGSNGGPTGSVTPPGTYSLTVSASRNGLTHSFPITLTVR